MVEKKNHERKSNRVARTRRQALKAVGSVGVGGALFSGAAAANEGRGVSEEVREWAPQWWVEKRKHGRGPESAPRENPLADVQLVEKGSKEWVSDDANTQEWFSINEGNEAEYISHGAFTTSSAELCLPTTVKVGETKVGIEACHYGGCEWKLSACAVACIGTGMNDSCDGYYSLSGDLGVVNADLSIYPDGELIYPSTVMVLTDITVTGELCYYYVTGTDCVNTEHTFNII